MKVFVLLALFFASTLASDCVGSFGDWQACVGTCGAAGTQKRVYTVQIPDSYGAACPHATGYEETRACTLACPENDCVGAWEAPTACVSNGVCGSDAGKQTRTYKVSKPQGPGGAACAVADGATEQLACSAAITACKCCEGSFSGWTTCESAGTCDSDVGSQTRTYTVTNPGDVGGTPCPHATGFVETKACKAPITPCKGCIGSFSEPTACVSNGVCGSDAGTQKRTYTITQEAGPGGYQCPHANGFVETVACAAPVTPCQGCVGSYSEFSACESDGRCGSPAGKKSRKFTVTTPAGPGGAACEAADGHVDTVTCDAAVTPCKGCVGSWSAYTACKSNGQCSSDAGTRQRTYTISEPGEEGGARCEATNNYVETSACSAPVTPCAAVDCEGSFGAFSTCRAVASCGTTVGTQKRSFTITKQAAYGGKACDFTNLYVEKVNCEVPLKPCPVGCVGTWGTPTECKSKGICSSAAGTRTYTYTITTPAAYGGANCPATTGATRQENCDAPITPCPPENGVGQWSPWSECRAHSCGSSAGERSATYTVISAPKYGGAQCEAAQGQVKTEACEAVNVPCPVDCIGAYSKFSACASRGICSSAAGTRSRTFEISQPAAHGGKECSIKEGTVQSEECGDAPMTKCPPEPCEGSWEAGPCTEVACGGTAGTSAQVYKITKQARYEGTPCEAETGDKRTVPCTLEKARPCPIDCAGVYSEWLKCAANEPCGTTKGTKTRKYSVLTKAQFGGRECPRTDASVESEDCEVALVKCPPVDCTGFLSEPTPCKQTKCDAAPGTHTQTFTVTQPALHEGKECDYKNGEVVPGVCAIAADKVERCPIDCVGDFGAHTECVAVEECGCARGRNFKTYNVSVKAQFGGKLCPFADGEKVHTPCVVPANKVKRCPDVMLDAPCEDLAAVLAETKNTRCKLEAIVAALEQK